MRYLTSIYTLFGALNGALNGGVFGGIWRAHSRPPLDGYLCTSTAVDHDMGCSSAWSPLWTAPEWGPKGVPKGAPFRPCLGYPL